jgi:hypothetical protein
VWPVFETAIRIGLWGLYILVLIVLRDLGGEVLKNLPEIGNIFRFEELENLREPTLCYVAGGGCRFLCHASGWSGQISLITHRRGAKSHRVYSALPVRRFRVPLIRPAGFFVI